MADNKTHQDSESKPEIETNLTAFETAEDIHPGHKKVFWLLIITALVVSGAGVYIWKSVNVERENAAEPQSSTSHIDGETGTEQVDIKDLDIFKDLGEDQHTSTSGDASMTLRLVNQITTTGTENSNEEGGDYDYVITAQNGGKQADIEVELLLTNIAPADCKLFDDIFPDDPDLSPSTRQLEALEEQTVAFSDGIHRVRAECSAMGATLKASQRFMVADGQPEKCKDFTYFKPNQSTAVNLSELTTGISDTWSGCVDTPWTAAYFVTITFSTDGTYIAESAEVLDTFDFAGGFYIYSIPGPQPNKKYGVQSYQNGLGQGFIDIVHPNGTTIHRGDLRNIVLSGDKLTFDFYHQSQYGPLIFNLSR